MTKVLHSIRCSSEGCDARDRMKESMVRAERGIAYPDDASVEPMRCEICDSAMEVVYRALNLGGVGSGRNVRDDGLVATSSDGTTCGYGRKVVAEAAIRQLAPGERGRLTVQGVEMFASRSTDGSRVDMTHIGRSDAGVKVKDL